MGTTRAAQTAGARRQRATGAVAQAAPPGRPADPLGALLVAGTARGTRPVWAASRPPLPRASTERRAGTASRPHRPSGSGGRGRTGTAPCQWYASTQRGPPNMASRRRPPRRLVMGDGGALMQGARVGVSTRTVRGPRGALPARRATSGASARPRRPSAAPIKTTGTP